MEKRIITLLLSLIVLAGATWAQQSDSKKINSIKRNSQYLYAEATMNTEEEAYQVAEELLTTYINEYIESKKKLNKAESVIVKDIASKCDKIQMMRGEMYRVFVYVKKSDIIPAENSITLVKPETPDSIADTEGVPPAVIEVLPSGEGQSADGMDAAPGEAPRLSEAWQQNVIDELLSLSSLTEAKALMNRLKAEYKIKRYGSYDECKNPANSFWLIADGNGRLQTILGPGTDRRTNFKTLQYDALENYSGFNAIWFTLSK